MANSNEERVQVEPQEFHCRFTVSYLYHQHTPKWISDDSHRHLGAHSTWISDACLSLAHEAKQLQMSLVIKHGHSWKTYGRSKHMLMGTVRTLDIKSTDCPETGFACRAGTHCVEFTLAPACGQFLQQCVIRTRLRGTGCGPFGQTV